MGAVAFGAWAQTAIGAALARRDDGAPDLGDAAFTPAALVRGPGSAPPTPVARDGALHMLGPGSVARLDPRSVVRMQPAPGSVDAAANDLAAIELTPPELPWVLTPARGAGTRRLRPWLVLVVVDADVRFEPDAVPLPLLHAPIAQLPDLAQSWAWAHTQGPPGGAPAFARLLCPRRLAEQQRYRACLVPATRAGVLAGTSPTGAGAGEPGRAWEVGQGGEVTLPVLHWWEFATAPGGDFEALASRLEAAEDLSAMAGIEIDLRRPWPGAASLGAAGAAGAEPPTTPATIRMSGALRPLGAGDGDGEPTATPLQAEERQEFVGRLSRQLNQPAELLAGRGEEELGGEEEAGGDRTGAVAPPLYGGRHAHVDRVEPSPELPLADLGWVTELNLDPRRRVAAGLGARFVQRHQERLMTQAWEQVGAIREANRLRAMADLASGAAASVHRRHVRTLQPGELVAFAAPAAARTPTSAATTLALELRVSPLPAAAASAPLARALRAGSVAARRSGTSATSIITRGLRGAVLTPEPAPVLAPSTDPATMDLSLLDPARAARQLVLVDAVRRVAETNDLGGGAGLLTEQLGAMDGMAMDASALASGDVAGLAGQLRDRADLMDTAREVFTTIAGSDFATMAAPDGREVTLAGVQIAPELLAGRLAAALEPGDRHARRLASRIALPPAWERPNLEPVMAYPTFGVPMAMSLLAEDPEWFLPGLGSFPVDRVALLETDDKFVESYLVGANQELLAELLWREYPTDRRGSPFRRFWPRPADADVPELHTWSALLGEHLLLQGESFALVLIRGEVIRRFPDMLVSAVKAVLPADARVPDVSRDPADARPTMFAVRVDEATMLYAIGVPPDELVTPMSHEAPGWFVVLAEHDYRMRFGFDLGNAEARTWNDVDWPRVSGARPGFADVAHQVSVSEPADLAWGPGSDAVQIARISLQAPFRVAIHATHLLRKGG